VGLVSITQELGDDPISNMIRQIMAMLAEYQPKENAKHTLRAMKENARQGFWNGALPPIGYRIVEASEQRGHGPRRRVTRTRLGCGGTESHISARQESAGSTCRYTGKLPFKKRWTFSWIGEGSIPPLGADSPTEIRGPFSSTFTAVRRSLYMGLPQIERAASSRPEDR